MSYHVALQLILLVIVFISKEFLVFNEEILVLISFFVFIFLNIKFVKNTLNSIIDEKTSEIRSEFELYKVLQKKTISYVINYHVKQVNLIKKLDSISLFSKDEIFQVDSYFSLSFKNRMVFNFENKLKKMISLEFQKILFVQSYFLSLIDNFFLKKYRFLVTQNVFLKHNNLLNCLDVLNRL